MRSNPEQTDRDRRDGCLRPHRAGVWQGALRVALIAGLMLGATATWAAPADLPDARSVLAALDNHPQVRAAEARLRAAQAEHGRLRAGSHEFGLRLNVQRRAVNAGPDHHEWEAAIERGLRLPGKGRLDERIGALGVEEAEARVGDVRHETAKQLLTLWYASLQAQTEVRLWREQIALLEAEGRIVQTRIKSGDAAPLQRLQIEAALAQAASQLGQAEARARTALAELSRNFPELPPPADQAAEPVLPDGGEAEWLERALAHNHARLAAQLAAARAGLIAQRAQADRQPDPVIGLRYAHEQGGMSACWGSASASPCLARADARWPVSWQRRPSSSWRRRRACAAVSAQRRAPTGFGQPARSSPTVA